MMIINRQIEKAMFKRVLIIGFIIFFTCSYGLTVNQNISQVDERAAEILQKVSQILVLKDTRSEQVMTVCRKDGTIRQYRLRIMTSGMNMVFAEIIEPKQFQGRQLLRLDDTVWAYFPDRSALQSRAELRAKRAIRVSGKEKFMGGDFTNNDVLRLNLLDDYSPKIVEDIPDQYVLELKGKDVRVAYETVRLWVRKVDLQPIRMECYTISDELIKSVFYQDYRDFGDGFVRPGMLEIKSAVLPKSKTFLEIIYLKRGVKNPTKRFLRSSLGK
ncbi:MAG: outer membrane lipoprotein-sorting protein [Desulfobacteraceae bacterium]|jgi:outer membrane lipoprotein-sorting protein